METPVVPDGFRSSWAQYTIRLRDGATRDALQAFMKAAGIPSMVYYPKPMHLQTAFAQDSRPEQAVTCPVATRLCSEVLSLPMHPYISEEETGLVVNTIQEFLK